MRVTENSSTVSINHRINKTKSDMENLQLKGASLKNINRASDNPIGHAEVKTIESILLRSDQYIKNINMATLILDVTERSLEDVSDILNRAHELAIGLSSATNSPEVRRASAPEIQQLFDEMVLIANQTVNNRYIFGGYTTNRPPFNERGKFSGDEGIVRFEISRDHYVKTNLNGRKLFLGNDFDENIFFQLDKFYNASINNDPKAIQEFIGDIEKSTSRIVRARTEVGMINKSIANIMERIDNDKINNIVRKGKIVDADVVELFTDIKKQEDILKSSYQISKNLLSQNLLNFIR